MSRSLLDRIADRFVVGDECWDWLRPWKRGYGYIYHDGRNQPAHRVIYELLVGPVPPGYELDHLCRNKACVRPSHLEPVLHVDNMRRAIPHRQDGFRSLKEHNQRERARTHCKSGHEFTKENTYWRPTGGRDCRTCMRARKLAFVRRADG